MSFSALSRLKKLLCEVYEEVETVLNERVRRLTAS